MFFKCYNNYYNISALYRSELNSLITFFPLMLLLLYAVRNVHIQSIIITLLLLISFH